MCINSDRYFLRQTWKEVRSSENRLTGRVARSIETMFSTRDPELKKFIDFEVLNTTIVQKVELLVNCDTDVEMSEVFNEISDAYVKSDAPKKTHDILWIILFDAIKSISKTSHTMKAESAWLQIYNDNRQDLAV